MIYENKLKDKLIELIKILCTDIDDEVQNSYCKFNVVLSKKELVKNETYKNRTMTVNNLFREECEVANSLIVCLAHHIDFCNRGETDNKKEFVKLYQTILFCALENQYIDFNELKASNDFNNSKLLQDALSSYWPSNYTSNKCILEVYNSFAIKDYLKAHKFEYNMQHQSWDLEIDSNRADEISKIILNKSKDLIVKTRNPNKIVFGAVAYICVLGNTYKYRDLLKQEHYFYKKPKWCKRIMANEYLSEKKKIENLLPKGQGLKVCIEY